MKKIRKIEKLIGEKAVERGEAAEAKLTSSRDVSMKLYSEVFIQTYFP